jgi:hypothetical protein
MALMPETPEERREAQIEAIAEQRSDHVDAEIDGHAPPYTSEHAIDALLAYFDQTDPVLAKIIREGWPSDAVRDAAEHGLTQRDAHDDYCGARGFEVCECGGPWDYLFSVNYPEGEEP